MSKWEDAIGLGLLFGHLIRFEPPKTKLRITQVRVQIFSWEQNIVELQMCKNEHTDTSSARLEYFGIALDAQFSRIAFAPATNSQIVQKDRSNTHQMQNIVWNSISVSAFRSLNSLYGLRCLMGQVYPRCE